MKDLKCENATKVSEEDIELVQKKVNYVFPKEFVEFIKENSGGYPACDCINIDGDIECVNNFLDFQEDGYNYVVSIYLSNKGLQVHGCIPFARDAGSNYYCFSRKDNRVLFWDHEECDEFDGPFIVCKNFKTFVNKLFCEEL